MEQLMTAYGRYKTVLENVEQAKEMLEDPDLRDMAKEELSELEPEQEALERELQLLLLPKDPNDDRNVIVEIRAGTGGEEAALFASELARMYTHYADARGWKTEELDAATVSILKTPENAQTPIELPEEEEARKTPPPEPVTVLLEMLPPVTMRLRLFM